MSKRNDTDYLFISARVKAMESRLLGCEQTERMLESNSAGDAAAVLEECGYPELTRVSHQTLEDALAVERRRVAKDLSSSVPEPGILEVFQVKYDYHNAKCIVKAEAIGTDPAGLLMDFGRIPATVLMEAASGETLRALPSRLRSAIEEGRETLGSTGDPQLSDFALDRACYGELSECAHATGIPLLEGYVRLLIDAENLRAVVRALRMGKDLNFLQLALFEEGTISTFQIRKAVSSGGSLERLFHTSPLCEAAEEGVSVLGGGGLTRFEKLCDEAVGSYLSPCRLVPFGAEPVIGYLAAKETEYTTIRIILSGLMAGLDRDKIRERLREPYV